MRHTGRCQEDRRSNLVFNQPPEPYPAAVSIMTYYLHLSLVRIYTFAPAAPAFTYTLSVVGREGSVVYRPIISIVLMFYHDYLNLLLISLIQFYLH